MIEWITGIVEQTGYLGIALLMLAENVFPPIPSELIMPLAGFIAAQGGLGLPGVILAGAAGSVAGALFWYQIGRWFGLDRLRLLSARHGRWLTVHPDELDRARDLFDRYSGRAVLGGRLIPAVRSLISVPAGVAGMGMPRFLLFSTLGTALWSALLGGAGYVLQTRWSEVASWLGPVGNAVLAAMLAWYVYRVVRFRRTEG